MEGKKKSPKKRNKLFLYGRTSKGISRGLVLDSRGPKWKRKDPPYTVGIDDFTYADIPCNLRPVDPRFYLPLSYDLVGLVCSNGRTYSGWWSGKEWISLRHRNREVIKWKRNKDLY